MAKVNCPKRICDISERAFWSSLSAPKNGPELADAIRLGRSEEKTEAYQRLGQYHRRVLADELMTQRKRLLAVPAPNAGQTAEDLLRHRITTWHSSVAEFGDEIDWNYTATDQYGFHYLGWLTPGIRRLMETGDLRYRNCLIDIVSSYYRSRNALSHPVPNVHLVYNELGGFAKSYLLLPLYLNLLEAGDIPVETHEAFMKLFLGFGRCIYDLQGEYRTGNWQIAGCSALFMLARVFPEFKESDSWEEKALRYLKEHISKDFYSDGGHKERCCGYGFMSLEAIVNAHQTARRYGGLGDADVYFLRHIRQGFRWFAHISGPTEHTPSTGDSELSCASSILDMAQEYSADHKDRFLGVDRTQSSLLKPSGFAIMRNGDNPSATYVNLSFGEFAGWHAHMDCLSMNLWAYGKPLIEEFGMIGGYGEALMILARAAESHNQLTLDGMHYDNADHTVPGKEHRLTGSAWEHPDFMHRAGRDPVWHSTPEFDFFSAWHSAYRANWREPQHVDAVVRRTVVFVKNPGYVLVSDVAWEENSNNEGPNFSVTQNWHSPFPFEVTDKSGSVRTIGSPGCLLTFAPQPHLRRLETGIDYTTDEVSGHKPYTERFNLRARRWMPVEYRGATGVTVVLFPFEGPAPVVTVETLSLADAPLFRAGAFAITTPHGRDLIAINPEHLPGITCDENFDKTPLNQRALLKLHYGRVEATVP